jgi:alpha-galactosidase
MKGPYSVLSRGKVSNYTSFASDSRAAWQNAMMWYITKDQAHWDRSTSILDAWGSNLTDIIGTDRSLLIGLDGDLLVNAAEIMRWEGKWTEAGASWRGGSGFSNQLYWLFSRQAAVIGQANYGMVSIKSLLSFAVYLDDVTLYNYAMNAFINDPCAGIFAMYKPSTGQSVESGRDQGTYHPLSALSPPDERSKLILMYEPGHTISGIAWTAYAARVAQTQGVDLYKLGDNLLLKASEYSAAYNLNETVAYDPAWHRCEAVLVGAPWATIAEYNRGISNALPAWDILYYQYAVKRKLKAPWTSKAQSEEGPEGAVATNDHPSWGGLIWAY